MALSTSSLVWVVVGGVLGFLFFLTCVISVVKAVRDRQRIKARNQARRAALTNGRVPQNTKWGDNSQTPRPNIILIPDTEKEQRVKRGRGGGTSSIPSLTLTSQASLSSPGDLSSSCVAISTVAQVTGPSTDIACISGGAVHDGVRVDSQVLPDGSYLLGNHNGHLTGGGDVFVDTGTEVVTFRRSSTTGGGEGSGEGRVVSAFPVSVSAVVDQVPVSDHGGVFTDRPQRPWNNGSHSQLFQPTSKSFHGFTTRAANVKATLYSTKGVKGLRNAGTSPRRYSYAADSSSAVWVGVPPQRRHSDECRRVISDSVSRLYHNAVRIHRFRGGTDNPAYEALDDEGVVWKEI